VDGFQGMKHAARDLESHGVRADVDGCKNAHKGIAKNILRQSRWSGKPRL
jgi:hypothetical protein